MIINVHSNGKSTVFQLNDSQAAKDFYTQMPMNIEVENYSHNEKIFYPPNKLATSNTPLANAMTGTLAYYAPWGNVVMFYKDFGTASGLYELGHAFSGIEHIKNLSGTIQIEKVDQLFKTIRKERCMDFGIKQFIWIFSSEKMLVRWTINIKIQGEKYG